MKITEIMTKDVRVCHPTDSINRAAQIMWENDCGCVPVVEEGKLVGIITDRDISMAAYTQGRRLEEMSVGSASSKNLVTLRETDSVHRAERLMHDAQVHRLPVVDADGRLVGLLSISDLARNVRFFEGIPGHILGALAGISQRRSQSAAGAGEITDGIVHAGQELKKELKKSVALLNTLRDEVRVRLHLGSLDLKDQWKKLEPQLGEIEKRADELTEASRAALADAVKKLETFRSALSGHN